MSPKEKAVADVIRIRTGVRQDMGRFQRTLDIAIR